MLLIGRLRARCGRRGTGPLPAASVHAIGLRIAVPSVTSTRLKPFAAQIARTMVGGWTGDVGIQSALLKPILHITLGGVGCHAGSQILIHAFVVVRSRPVTAAGIANLAASWL